MKTQDKKEIYWVNKKRERIPLAKMDDSYLYNTVKCIWNNKIGHYAPFGDVIHWNFVQEVHSDDFLSEFFSEGLEELRRRDPEIARSFISWIDQNVLDPAKNSPKYLHDFFELDEAFNEQEFGDFGDK